MDNKQVSTILQNHAAQEPHSVKIEVGKCYRLTDHRLVEILAIRTNVEQTGIYYRYPTNSSSFWGSDSYNYGEDPLETFKSKLRDLGGIDSITVSPLKAS